MSDLFVQKVSASGTTTAVATVNSVVAGNALVAFLWDGSTSAPTTHTVSDAQGTYVAKTSAADATNAVFSQTHVLVNANSGTHTVTGTIAAGGQCFLMVVEVGSSSGASAYSGDNAAFQNSPGAGANALSSGSMTVSALSTIVSMTTDSHSVTASDEPTVGTSPFAFTSRDNNTSAAIGAYRLQTASGSTNGAATAGPVTTTDQFLTLGIAILNGGSTPDQPQDGVLDSDEEDYDHHEGTTEAIAFGGNPNISQSYEAEWAEEDYDHHEGVMDVQVSLGGDNLIKQAYEAEWAEEDYDHHEGIIEAPVALGGDNEIKQSFEAEWSDEDYDAHEGSTDPIIVLAVNDTSNPFGDFDDGSFYWDGDDELDIIDDYDNSDLTITESLADEYVDEDYEHHEGTTEAITPGGDNEIKQSFEAEFVDEDYDDLNVSTDAVIILVVVAPDQPQSVEDDWVDDDYDPPEVSTDAVALGGDNEIRQSFEALWDEEDYDDPDVSTDALVILLTPPPIQSFEDEWTDDDYDVPEVSTDVVALGGDNEIKQSFEAEWDDEDYDPPDVVTDVQVIAVPNAPLPIQSFEAEWDDEDYDAPEVSTDQVSLGGDNEIRQSYEAEFDEEDYDAHDGSTDTPAIIFILSDIPQSYEAEDSEEDYDPLDTTSADITTTNIINLIPGVWTWSGTTFTGLPGSSGFNAGGIPNFGPLDWPPNYYPMVDDQRKDTNPWIKWFNDIRNRVLAIQNLFTGGFIPPIITINTRTANYTLVAADYAPITPTMVRMNVAGACTLTFPQAPVGSVVGWMQYGAGQVTLTPGVGIFLRSSGSLTSRTLYSSGTALMISPSEWLIEGDTT